jgi:cardiolipin hydrolase
MHHKFAVVDGAKLINGSFNWTRQAVLGNQENIVIVADAKLCATFTKEFDSMWGKFSGNKYGGGGGNRA